MTRIRVNTDDLEAKATDFESAAKAFNAAGDDILAAAMSMPSYEGQLSGPARAAAYEIQKQSRDVHASLSGDAESLRRTAQAFNDANNQAVESLKQNQNILLSATLSPTHPPQNGNAYLGYQDDGKSDTVILCIYGTCKIVPRKGHEDEIAKFEKAVDDYYTDMGNEIGHAETLIKEFGAALGASIAAGAATIETGGWGALVTGIVGLIAMKTELDAEMADNTLVLKDINDATFYWNAIFGDILETDDNQMPADYWQRKTQGIYEP